MKLRKILASFAALAIAATAFSGVVMANSYGTPELKMTIEYPYDFYGDPEDCDYLVVKLSYEGFEGFSAYKKQAGVGITSIGVTLDYDSDKLSYEDADADKTKFPGVVLGTKAPSVQWAAATAGLVPEVSYDDFATFVFAPEDGVDLTTEKLTFNVTAIEFGVTKAVKGEEPVVEKYGNSAGATEAMKADAGVYGSSEPQIEYVNVTTDGNVNGVDDGQIEKGSVVTVSAKAVEGKTAQLYANDVAIDAGDYTVNEDTSFRVEYTDIPVVNPYTYKVADYGKNEAKAGIFYALAIKNSENVMTLGVAGKSFTATDVPVVEGDTELTMTYVILGVPAELLTDVPAETTLTGAVNGAYELAE